MTSDDTPNGSEDSSGNTNTIETPSAQPTVSAGFLDGVTRQVTKLSTVVTIAVSISATVVTGLTSCSEQARLQNQAMDERLAKEEGFWRGLYDEYKKSIDTTGYSDDEGHRTKEMERDRKFREVIFAIADSKQNPSFTILPVTDVRKDYLDKMRTSLLDLIKSQTPEVAATSEDKAATATEVRARDIAVEVPQNAVNDSANLNYTTQILSAGAKNGYDIDVFWCDGDERAGNYNRARNAAVYLAGLGSAGNMPLGRIRLRVLTLEKQNGAGGYPKQGMQIRWDDTASKDELRLATALQAKVKTNNDLSLTLRPSYSATSYYLSIFICSMPPAQTAAAPSNGSAS